MAKHLVAALVVVVAAFPATARADDKYVLKQADAAPPQTLPEPFRALLNHKSFQVVDGAGEVKCEIWLRKELPLEATEAQVRNGLTYEEVPVTSVLGAIRFPAAYQDYRKQDVDPGIYLLRLAKQPQDGDHMGTAPHQEFCLLTSPEFDAKPELIEPKALMDISARTLSGSHPGVMLLFPNAKPGDAPALVDQGQGHWVLKARLDVNASGRKAVLGIGLTVVGHSAAVN